MKVSFIIPTFNTPVKPLKRCLTSIFEQDKCGLDFEVIVVNDGSTDNELLDYLNALKGKTNLIILSKTNGGVSSARNFGLTVASGDYVCFIDADDYITKNFFYHISKHVLSKKDIFYFKNFVKLNNLVKRKNKVCSNNVVWGKLIKKDVITRNRIFFIENLKFCEDSLFMSSLTAKIETSMLIDEYLYVYNQNSFNATNSFSPNCYLDFSKSLSLLRNTSTSDDFYLICLIFFLNFVLPKAIYNRKSKFNNRQKRIIAIEILESKDLNYCYLFNIDDKKINKLRRFQLKLIKRHKFRTALFVNKIFLFFKFLLGRFF